MNQIEQLKQIQKARQGDLEAFNQLVLEYQAIVYNHALWLVQDREAADDLAQETFIKAYSSLTQYRGGSFRAWLLRIVTNTSLDELRCRKRRKTISLTRYNEYDEEIESDDWLRDPGVSVEERAEQRDFRVKLQRYIHELPEEHRMTILLVDLFEMKYDEAAAALDVPIGTVKSRLARARLHLRKRLEGSSRFLPNRIFETV